MKKLNAIYGVRQKLINLIEEKYTSSCYKMKRVEFCSPKYRLFTRNGWYIRRRLYTLSYNLFFICGYEEY